MKQAPHEARIIQQCMRERLPLPESIANAPQLHLGLELYFDAFFDLSTCRTVGLAGAGPIPWSSIRDYAVTFELSEEQMEDLFYYVRVMDNAFMAYHRPKKGGEGISPRRTRSLSSRSGWGSGQPKRS